jgi:hypothetical protein
MYISAVKIEHYNVPPMIQRVGLNVLSSSNWTRGFMFKLSTVFLHSGDGPLVGTRASHFLEVSSVLGSLITDYG